MPPITHHLRHLIGSCRPRRRGRVDATTASAGDRARHPRTTGRAPAGLALITAALVFGIATTNATAGAMEDEKILNILNNRCIDCHDDITSKADFRIDRLTATPDFDRDFVKWEHVLTRLVDRSMPPKRKRRRPTHEEYEAAIAWLRTKLSAVELDRAENKPRWMRRLNRDEYNNTVRDLFRIEGLRPAEAFPVDDALHGFDKVAEGLTISPLHVDGYLNAAYDVLNEVIVTGDRPRRTSFRHTFRFYGDRIGDGQLMLRDGNSILPNGYTPLRLFDDITLIGHLDSLEEVTVKLGY